MLTVKEILTDKITLDIECFDRVYLNGYVKHLQLPSGLITFIREKMGFPIPSPMVLPPFTPAFRKDVEKFAKEKGLSWPLPEGMMAEELEARLYPNKSKARRGSGSSRIGSTSTRS